MTKISLLGDSQLTLPIATVLSQKDLYAKVRVLGDISPQQLSVGQDAVSASGSYTDLDHCRSSSILEVSGIVIICVGEVAQRFHLSSVINEQITQINPTAKVLVLGRSVCALAASVARQLKDSPSRVIGIPQTFEAHLRRQIGIEKNKYTKKTKTEKKQKKKSNEKTKKNKEKENKKRKNGKKKRTKKK